MDTATLHTRPIITTHERAAKMYNAGWSRDQIRRSLGVSRQCMVQALQKAAARGLIDPAAFPGGDPITMLRDGRIRVGGGTAKMLLSMPEEVAVWLLDQVPPGGSVLDAIKPLLIEAYREAHSPAEARDD